MINPFLMAEKNLYVQINISLYSFVSINPVLDDNSFSDGWKNSFLKQLNNLFIYLFIRINPVLGDNSILDG